LAISPFRPCCKKQSVALISFGRVYEFGLRKQLALLSKERYQRTVFINAAAQVDGTHVTTYFAPVEAEVGYAVIFSFLVERYIRLERIIKSPTYKTM